MTNSIGTRKKDFLFWGAGEGRHTNTMPGF